MFLFNLMMCMFAPFFTSYCIYYLYFRTVGKIKPKKSKFKKVRWKEKNILFRLFIAFPRQLAHDTIRRNPDEFPVSEQGLYIIEGEQGAGKTTLMTYLLEQKKKKYPALKIYTNYNYLEQNEEFKDWKMQFNYQVGETGAIYAIDEIHIWLCSSLQSKDFPPELLTEICQNRKNHRAIYGTVQVFGRCPKPIREQCKLLYSPITIAGCLTFVLVRKPVIDENGVVKAYKFRKIFFFVQSDELRSKFNTFDIIHKMVDNKEIVRNNENILPTEDTKTIKVSKKSKVSKRIIGFDEK